MIPHHLRLAATCRDSPCLGLILAFPGGVAATTNEPIAQTGGMSATLPLLGTSLTVNVTLAATGDISGVGLSPATGLAQTSPATDKEVIRFSTADGTTKVTVKAYGDRLAIVAKTKTLASLKGNATWSADVFGTGSNSTVPYAIGDDGSGHPTLAIGSASTSERLVAATAIAVKSKTNGGASSVSGGVSFAYQGFVKRLTISVSVGKDGTAAEKITLSGKDRQKLSGALADLVGARTWTAHLCDGTKVTIAYHVTSDGKVVYDGATGGTAKEKAIVWPKAKDPSKDKDKSSSAAPKKASIVSANGFVAHFEKTWVGVSVLLVKKTDGTYALKVSGFSGFCGKHGHNGNGHGFGGHKYGAPEMHRLSGSSGPQALRPRAHRGLDARPRPRGGAAFLSLGGFVLAAALVAAGCGSSTSTPSPRRRRPGPSRPMPQRP